MVVAPFRHSTHRIGFRSSKTLIVDLLHWVSREVLGKQDNSELLGTSVLDIPFEEQSQPLSQYAHFKLSRAS
jgi:hypothetical protein